MAEVEGVVSAANITGAILFKKSMAQSESMTMALSDKSENAVAQAAMHSPTFHLELLAEPSMLS